MSNQSETTEIRCPKCGSDDIMTMDYHQYFCCDCLALFYGSDQVDEPVDNGEQPIGNA